jgi:hypothetical protein
VQTVSCNTRACLSEGPRLRLKVRWRNRSIGALLSESSMMRRAWRAARMVVQRLARGGKRRQQSDYRLMLSRGECHPILHSRRRLP